MNPFSLLFKSRKFVSALFGTLLGGVLYVASEATDIPALRDVAGLVVAVFGGVLPAAIAYEDGKAKGGPPR